MDAAKREIELLEREEEYTYNRWNFAMLLIIGVVLISAGLFRIIHEGFIEIDAFNLILITIGAFLLTVARYWTRKKKPSDEEIRQLDEEEVNQYEMESASFGFRDKFYQSKERDEYEQKERKESIPDIRKEDLNNKD